MKNLILIFLLVVSMTTNAQITLEDVIIPNEQITLVNRFIDNLDYVFFDFMVDMDYAYFIFTYDVSHAEIRRQVREVVFHYYTVQKDWYTYKGDPFITFFVNRKLIHVCQEMVTKNILIQVDYKLK
jgi:hypothetical protein